LRLRWEEGWPRGLVGGNSKLSRSWIHGYAKDGNRPGMTPQVLKNGCCVEEISRLYPNRPIAAGIIDALEASNAAPYQR
jgi:hypothetical protein